MEDLFIVKGIVRREVIRVIIFGIVLDGNLFENKKNNYLLFLYKDGINIGLIYVDISIGEINVICLNEDKVIEEIVKIYLIEIIINDLDFIEKFRDIVIVSNIYINESFSDNYLDINILKEYFLDVYL